MHKLLKSYMSANPLPTIPHVTFHAKQKNQLHFALLRQHRVLLCPLYNLRIFSKPLVEFHNHRRI